MEHLIEGRDQQRYICFVLDLLTPALLGAPGAALVTLTKEDDLLPSFPVRWRGDRRCLVPDPFGLATGLLELVWDPVAGWWIR